MIFKNVLNCCSDSAYSSGLCAQEAAAARKQREQEARAHTKLETKVRRPSVALATTVMDVAMHHGCEPGPFSPSDLVIVQFARMAWGTNCAHAPKL